MDLAFCSSFFVMGWDGMGWDGIGWHEIGPLPYLPTVLYSVCEARAASSMGLGMLRYSGWSAITVPIVHRRMVRRDLEVNRRRSVNVAAP
jgi:hypothetical protein